MKFKNLELIPIDFLINNFILLIERRFDGNE